MSKTLRTLMAAMLVSTAFAALAAPTAQAHECKSVDPAEACGPCDDLFPHVHRYNDDSIYCTSDPITIAKELINGGGLP